jgi:pseudaminic acid synthase
MHFSLMESVSMKAIQIGSQQVGLEHPPFIIAEMSGNHNQSLERALEIVDAAATAGAHAIKLQTYTADTMTLNVDHDDFKVNDPNSLWYGRHLYELYEEAHTPWEWHKPIMERAAEHGMLCFSSPFDATAVDFLETLNVPAYKIASFENTDVNLIRKVCATGKPVIISTGMASLEDLQLMVNTLREAKCENFMLLKCTSAYPASPADANLKTMPHMGEMMGCQVGLSDHTMGVGVSLAAVALGATVIEKHFCLSREEGGVDSAFSLEPHELKILVEESEKVWQSLGRVQYKTAEVEGNSKQVRRSIYFVKDMKAGDKITEDCIRCIRPGFGLAPKWYDKLIGQRVSKDVVRGEPCREGVLA